MDADSLSIPGLVSQLELAVDRNLASLGHDDAISAAAKLQLLLSGVLDHLNALSPINRLPPEMFATIFREVVNCRVPVFMLDELHSSFKQDSSDRKRTDARPLLCLAHVCRRWRSAALGDASLWSHVDVSYPEAAVRFFLQCSSGYPLTLYASMESENVTLVDRILEDHGARIRAVYADRKQKQAAESTIRPHAPQPGGLQNLHPAAFIPGAPPFPPAGPPFNLAAAAPATSQSVFHRFCTWAPQLECFVLQELQVGPSPMSLFELGQDLYHILFDSPLKALALLLPEAYFPINSFPNLAHLFLSFPLWRSDVQGCEKSLLEMLSRAPQLQFLQLSNLGAQTSSPNGFVFPLPQVSLEHLRLLAFSDVQLEVAFNLLKYLTLPESVLLSIEAATFMEISISINYDALLLTGYDARFTSGFLFKAHDLSTFWGTAWLLQLHSMTSLSGITVLHFNDNEGRVLPHLLPYFTQLEELSVLLLPGGRREAGMVHTASALFASLTPSSTALVCPALRLLGLEADIGDKSFPYTKLQAMAARRHQRGCALRRFVYHWHGSSAWWRPGSEMEKRDILLRVKSFLTPSLQPYVDSIEYRLSWEEGYLCPFYTPECWRVPDAEKYWNSKTPVYDMHWDIYRRTAPT